MTTTTTTTGESAEKIWTDWENLPPPRSIVAHASPTTQRVAYRSSEKLEPAVPDTAAVIAGRSLSNIADITKLPMNDTRQWAVKTLGRLVERGNLGFTVNHATVISVSDGDGERRERSCRTKH